MNTVVEQRTWSEVENLTPPLFESLLMAAGVSGLSGASALKIPVPLHKSGASESVTRQNLQNSVKSAMGQMSKRKIALIVLLMEVF